MPLRTAVVGTGTVARNNHLPAVTRNPRTELVAVCDVDEERAREVGVEHGARPYVDVTTMLEAESLDWVHVATPLETHYDLARRIIGAGVPTTLQKPATRTIDELDELLALASDAHVPVSVVHNWLFYPVVRTVRRRIGAGEIGRVRAVETTFAGEGSPDETYRGEWVFGLPGGEFEEGMPHPLYLTTAIGGDPPTLDAVNVQTRRIGEYDREIAYDGLSLHYVSEGGALCDVTYLSGSAPNQLLAVHGEDGALLVDLLSRSVRAHDPDAGPYHFFEERLNRNVGDLQADVGGLATNVAVRGTERIEERFDVHLDGSPDGHYYLFERVARALQQGHQLPVPLERSRWTVGLMERVREAATVPTPA